MLSHMNDLHADSLVSYNPANGSRLGRVAVATRAEIAATVDEARAQLAPWQALAPDKRAALLQRGAEEISRQLKPLSQLLSMETGKPRRASLREINNVADTVGGRCKDILRALRPQVHQGSTIESLVRFDPIGVCAVITPAYHPVAMTHRMLIPALLAGNTVVLKPSPDAPLIGQRMAEIYQRHLPANVLQIVHGRAEQGRNLVAANVQLIAFTGSSRAGKHIVASAAFGLKRVILAMSGKDTMIVMADADLDAAARFAVESSLGNGGQMCISTELVMVDQRIADRFAQKVARLASQYRIGTWDDPKADIGPMPNPERREKVLLHIRDALDKGAKALCGGSSHPEHFIRPTVLSGVNSAMTIMHQETLGPVLCVASYRAIDDAIALCNQSSFALGATVFGQAEAAGAVASRLDAGMVGINKSIFGVGDIPWVGAKQSGYGFHSSPDGYRQFTQTRVLSRSTEASGYR